IPKPDEGDVAAIVVFSGDGAVMAVRHSLYQIKLLDPSTGRELASLEPPFPSPVDGLFLSPRGTRLVASTRTGVASVSDLRRSRRQLAGKNLDWTPAFSSSPGTEESEAPALRIEMPVP